MDKVRQRELGARLLALHHGPPILMLPNVWDVVSARLYEVEGFPAVATTSAGVAATLGYPDGERMSLDENLEVVRRITTRVGIPVSADIEAGYGDTPEGVAESVRKTIAAGAVGINLEDGTGDTATPLIDTTLHAEKIAAAREAATSSGLKLVINARTDVILVADTVTAGHIQNTLERAAAYRLAGADCIFVPDMGTLDRAAISELVEGIDAPVNIIAGPSTPPLHELQAIGVSRVTVGPRPMRIALAQLRRIAREWRNEGNFTSLGDEALSYSEVNTILTRSPED